MAVVLLVTLRVTIGWHFFYEGVWKIAHPDEFSATPFLTTAKGPAAPLFYAMVYDIDGRQRLAQPPAAIAPVLAAAWQKTCNDARTRFTRRIEAEICKRENKAEKDKRTKKLPPLTMKESDELRDEVDKQMVPIESALWQTQDRLAAWLEKYRKPLVALLGERTAESKNKLFDEIRAPLAELQAIDREYVEALAKIAGEDPAKAAALGSPQPLLKKLDLDAPAEKLVDQQRILMPGGKPVVQLGASAGTIYVNAWDGQRAAAIKKYGLTSEQTHEANRVFRRYAGSLGEYFDEHRDDIKAYFGSLDRFEAERKAGGNNTDFQKKRVWDEQQKLRGEANVWLADLDAMGEEYRTALRGILTEKQKAKGSVPVGWTRGDLMDLAVTWSLTAIGLCMIIGLCNRLACLGGAAFLVSVLLTQPPWPTIYPPAPEVVGHALIVDKNFVEMVAMLALASLPVGRWGGLDAFLYRWFGQRFSKDNDQ